MISEFVQVPRSPVEIAEDSDPVPALKGLQDKEMRYHRCRWSQGCGEGAWGSYEEENSNVLRLGVREVFTEQVTCELCLKD